MGVRDEYLDIIRGLDGDTAGRVAAWKYLKTSTNIYQGRVVACDYFPKLFDARLTERLAHVARTTYGILEKVMDRYLADPAYREVYEFDQLLVQLILADRGYASHLPFARIDLFLDEDDLSVRFCEFNADGSSGMNENRESENAIRGGAAFQTFAARHGVQSMNDVMFEGWVSEFLRIYEDAAARRDTYPGHAGTPHVALVDYLEQSVIEEFKLYRALFEARGVRCSIFDVRELEYANGVLCGHNPYEGLGHDGVPINAIWRRAVTTDVLAHREESTAFLRAYLDGAVVLIGSFLGQLIHDKQIFRVLYDPRTWAFLTPAEIAFIQETIPRTEYLTRALVDSENIKANPSRWIIKPTDGYGSKDVFPGPAYDAAEWAAIVEAHVDAASGVPFLAQEFITPYKTPSIPMRGNPGDETAPVQMNNNLTGLYLIDGKFAGIFSRIGPHPLILGRMGGLTAPSFWVDCPSPFAQVGGEISSAPAPATATATAPAPKAAPAGTTPSPLASPNFA